MNKLNDEVKEYRRRRTRRVVTMVLLAFVLGFLIGYTLLNDRKDAHAHALAPIVSAGVVAPLPFSADQDESPAPRASRSRLTDPGPRHHRAVHQPVRSAQPVSSPFERWRTSAAADAVVECESGRDDSANSHSGKYRGRWQMDSDFWRTYGGRQYAASPERASRYQQDLVAYRGWLARGWQPWTCARIVGLI